MNVNLHVLYESLTFISFNMFQRFKKISEIYADKEDMVGYIKSGFG